MTSTLRIYRVYLQKRYPQRARSAMYTFIIYNASRQIERVRARIIIITIIRARRECTIIIVTFGVSGASVKVSYSRVRVCVCIGRYE